MTSRLTPQIRTHGGDTTMGNATRLDLPPRSTAPVATTNQMAPIAKVRLKKARVTAPHLMNGHSGSTGPSISTGDHSRAGSARTVIHRIITPAPETDNCPPRRAFPLRVEVRTTMGVINRRKRAAPDAASLRAIGGDSTVPAPRMVPYRVRIQDVGKPHTQRADRE